MTIMWNRNGFIPLPFRRVKKSFFQVIRFRPVHSLKVCKLSSDVNCHHIRYSKFEIIQLQREESATKSNEGTNLVCIL